MQSAIYIVLIHKIYDELCKRNEKINSVSLEEDLSYYAGKSVKQLSKFEFDLLITEKVVRSGRPLQDFNDGCLY